MKNTLIVICFAAVCLLTTSCKDSDQQKTSVTETKETANDKLAEVTPDFHSYPQYVSCKIDGQPYVAYYDANHITGITNSLNMAKRSDFSTRADEVIINGKSKISELEFSFYTLAQKQQGTLTSVIDFYVQGHTDFPVNGDMKYVSFAVAPDQHLTLSSFKEGLLEGTFAFDVVDEKDESHVFKITEGVFKLQQEGKTSVKVDKNGDVNMDSLLKSVH